LADAGATGDGIAANADGGDRANSVDDLKEKGLCYVQVKITNVERGRVVRGRRRGGINGNVGLGHCFWIYGMDSEENRRKGSELRLPVDTHKLSARAAMDTSKFADLCEPPLAV